MTKVTYTYLDITVLATLYEKKIERRPDMSAFVDQIFFYCLITLVETSNCQGYESSI